MTILFSPIGTSDPMTQLGDGPMLHIVRHRNPDKIVLFLSPDMAQNQHSDERYTKAIELLSERLGRNVPEIEQYESPHEEVHLFDHYIDEFECLLKPLLEEAGGAPVLVNASSGTPAMEEAAVALGAFGHLNLELLQVETPRKGTNRRHDRESTEGYDTDLLWAANDDNQMERNRILEVQSPNFKDRLLRENIIELIKRYDYEAAESLADEMRTIDPDALDMIRAASNRLNLSLQFPSQFFGGTELHVISDDILLEYLYIMEVRLAQGHWAEFIRSLSPALTELMNRELAPVLPKSMYSSDKKGEHIDCEKISSNDKLKRIIRDCHDGQFVTNDHLANMVEAFCEDEERRATIARLRGVEKECRNPLAHTMSRSDREKLEKDCGMPLDEIMESLFMLHGSAQPGMYDRINDAILEHL